MPQLSERLTADLKDAMRAGDAARRDEIRGVLAMLQTEKQSKLGQLLKKRGLIFSEDAVLTPEQLGQIEQAQADSALTEDEQQAQLLLRVKQHRQSIEAFEKGGRQDLIDHEKVQLAAIETYLPQQVSAEELDAIIEKALNDTGAKGPQDMGKVMGALSAPLRGRADMKAVSGRIQELLKARST
jgi:uncharacterized protein YqeY